MKPSTVPEGTAGSSVLSGKNLPLWRDLQGFASTSYLPWLTGSDLRKKVVPKSRSPRLVLGQLWDSKDRGGKGAFTGRPPALGTAHAGHRILLDLQANRWYDGCPFTDEETEGQRGKGPLLRAPRT